MRTFVAGLVVALGVALVLGIGGYFVSRSTTFQFFGGLTARVDTTDRRVALTFDDGPTPGDLDMVLAALASRGVRATFFVNGDAVAAHPDLARRIVAAGHELGNHTWSHRRMLLVTPDEVASEVGRTDDVIRAAGWRGEILFRPPYGKKLLVLPWWLADHGRRTVTWDVAPEAYDGTPEPTDRLVTATLDRTRPGSIILLHPFQGRTSTQAAIGPVIDRLKARGYTFVTASELLGAR